MVHHRDNNGVRLLSPEYVIDAIPDARKQLAAWEEAREQRGPASAAVREATAERRALPSYATDFERSDAAAKIAAAERAERPFTFAVQKAREAFERLVDKESTSAAVQTVAASVALQKQTRAQELWAELTTTLKDRDVAYDYAGRPGLPWPVRASILSGFIDYQNRATRSFDEIVGGFDTVAVKTVADGGESVSGPRFTVGGGPVDSARAKELTQMHYGEALDRARY